MPNLHLVVRTFLIGLIGLGASTVPAQDYPSKPIRIVAGAPGSGSDFVSRIIAQGISGPLGQPVVIDNRIAVMSAELVSKAAPDGYTLLVQGASLWIVGLLQKMTYDVLNDFSPVTIVNREVLVLVVHPSLPAKSVKELIALAKAKPGALNYASGSIGGPAQLGVELFKSMSGTDIVGVPYKGSSAGITAVMSGEVQLTVYDAGLVMPHVKAGKLRALAATSAEPSALTPGLPTVAGSGLPGYELVGRTGVWAPAKTPAAIISRLNQEIVRLLQQPDVKEKFLASGAEAVGSSPEQSSATVKTELAKWRKVIKDANIKVD